MKRSLLALASSALVSCWFGALPAHAQPQQQEAQTFQVQGEDRLQGPYQGTLVVSQREDGLVDATRTVQFTRSGEERTQSGILRQRGERLRGVLREAQGITGRLQQRQAGSGTLVTLSLDEAAGTCEGACLDGRGAGWFRGSRAGPEQQAGAAPDVAQGGTQQAGAAPDVAQGAQQAGAAPDVAQGGLPQADGGATLPTQDAASGQPGAQEPDRAGEPVPEPQPIEPPPPPVRQLTGEQFHGKPVAEFHPDEGLVAPQHYAWKLRVDSWDAERPFQELLDALLADPQASTLESLVIGNWGEEGAAARVVATLAAQREKLPALRAIYFGDISQEEAEISWIEQTDLGPLLAAFPQLEVLHVKGGNGLGFGPAARHEALQELVVITGGMPGAAVRQIGAHELPALQHLELWLGEEDYGWDGSVEDLREILAGAKLPRLTYLGLKNSVIQDAIAETAAQAPVLARLETLDLSSGTLSDAGGRALLASEAIKGLKHLDLHHHWLSADVVNALQGLGISVDTSERQDDDEDDYRYVEVGE